jgi:molecular chaperone GrpE
MTTKENKEIKDQKAAGKKKSTTAQKKKAAPKASPQYAKIKVLEAALTEEKNKYLRLSADFDNYRKRTLKEKMDLTKLAGEGIFQRILPVLDDLERALKSVQESSDLDAVKEGIQLIYGKFADYLGQQGVKEIEAMHQEFNTDLHEAVSKFPAPEKKLKGKVVDVIEKGYYLNEKVIRYSKVIIGE